MDPKFVIHTNSLLLDARAYLFANSAYDFSGLAPFTVEALVTIGKELPRNAVVVAQGVQYWIGISFDLGANEGFVFASRDGATRFLKSPECVRPNSTVHVALVYDKAELKLYVDGICSATVATIAAAYADTRPFLIGGSATSPAQNVYQQFPGEVIDVKVWSYALRQEQILSNVYHEVAPQVGLEAHFDFRTNPPTCLTKGSAQLTAVLHPKYVQKTGGLRFISRDGAASCSRARAVPLDPPTTAFTLEAWVYLEEMPEGKPGLIYSSGDDEDYLLFGIIDGCLMFNIWGYPLRTDEYLVTGRWYHLAAAFENNGKSDTFCLYIDGKVVLTDDFPAIGSYPATSLRFGNPAHSRHGNAFVGYLQAFRIWRVSLTENELQEWSEKVPTFDPRIFALFQFAFLQPVEQTGRLQVTLDGGAKMEQQIETFVLERTTISDRAAADGLHAGQSLKPSSQSVQAWRTGRYDHFAVVRKEQSVHLVELRSDSIETILTVSADKEDTLLSAQILAGVISCIMSFYVVQLRSGRELEFLVSRMLLDPQVQSNLLSLKTRRDLVALTQLLAVLYLRGWIQDVLLTLGMYLSNGAILLILAAILCNITTGWTAHTVALLACVHWIAETVTDFMSNRTKAMDIIMYQAKNGDAFGLQVYETDTSGKTKTEYMQIDAGPAGTYSSAIKGRVPDRVKVLVGTHIDEDHIGGAVQMISAKDVSFGELWFNSPYLTLAPAATRQECSGRTAGGNETQSPDGADSLAEDLPVTAMDSAEGLPSRSRAPAATLDQSGLVLESDPGLEDDEPAWQSLRDAFGLTCEALKRNIPVVARSAMNPAGSECQLLSVATAKALAPSIDNLANFFAAMPALVPIDPFPVFNRPEICNRSSIVIKVATPVFADLNTGTIPTMLFTADAFNKSPPDLPRTYQPDIFEALGMQQGDNSQMHFTFLKVPHHGSELTDTSEFYRRVRARYYLISGDYRDNKVHPSAEVLIWIITLGRAMINGVRSPLTIYLTEYSEQAQDVVDDYPPDNFNYEMYYLNPDSKLNIKYIQFTYTKTKDGEPELDLPDVGTDVLEITPT